MPARYGTVSLTFWNDVKVRGWTEDGQRLALYLLTCPSCSFEGFYHLPLAVAAADLEWTLERLRPALGELVSTDFADVDERARAVLIVKRLKYHQFNGWKSVKGAINALDLVNDSPRLFARFLEAADHYAPELGDAIRDHYPALRDGPYEAPPKNTPQTNPTQP